MMIWILCCGEPVTSMERCGAKAYDAAMAAAAESAVKAYAGPAMKAVGRPVFLAPGRRARETAEQMIPDAVFQVEPQLAPVPRRAFRDTETEHSRRFWDWMAERQARMGNPRQPESRRRTAERAEELIQSLEKAGKDAILVTDESFLPVLLDGFRRHSCSIQRSGIFRYKPFERILVSRRDDHCGGCGHNCLLSNPGCGIGRDKAKRLSEGRRA